MKRVLSSVIFMTLLFFSSNLSFGLNYSFAVYPDKNESGTPPVVVFDPVANPVCPNAGQVTLHVNVSGGTPPYNYSWTGASSVNSSDPSTAYLTISSSWCSNTQRTVYVTVTAANSEITTESITITIKDDEAPIIQNSIPPYNGSGCSISVYPPQNTLAFLTSNGLIISDNCTGNNNLVVTSTDTQISSCPLSIERKYYVRDECGNQSSTTQTITLNSGSFALNYPNTTVTVECVNNANIPPSSAFPVVYDNCGHLLTPTLTNITNVPNIITCTGTRTYQYLYTDCEGNNATWSYIYNIFPTFSITVPNGEKQIDCISQATAPDMYLPTVTNSCGVPISASDIVLTSVIDNPNPINCNGERIYTYTFTDCAGNTATWSYTYIVDMPQFTIPDPPVTKTVNCVAEISDPSTLIPVVYDYCGHVITNIGLQSVISAPSTACEQSRTYTYRYTDCLGHTADWTYTFIINRNPFTITAPAGAMTVNCVAEIFEPISLRPAIPDNCGKIITNIALTNVVDSPSPLTCEGTRTYTYTYTDCSGNTGTWNFVFTVTHPAIVINTQPGSQTVHCVSDINLSNVILPTVYGACNTTLSGVITSDVSNPSPITCQGTRTITYTFTDCNSNSVDWTYTFIVEPSMSFSTPNQVTTVNCIANIVAPSTIPTGLDGCGNVITYTSSSITETPNTITCEGSRVYSYEYPDCNGNSHYWTSTFNVKIPTFTINVAPGSQTVNCVSDIIVPTAYLPTVQDACGNTLTPQLISTVDNPSPLNCNGTRTYTYKYTDCAGNTANWSYTYTVSMPAFTITAPAGAATVSCIGDIVEPLAQLPVVQDFCGNTINTISLSSITDSPNPITCNGTRTFTYTYTDCAGNTANWSYTYTVSMPSFSITAPNGYVTINCANNATPPNAFLPQVTDACGNIITNIQLISTIDTPNPLTCNGTRVYSYRYTDCAGNTDIWTFTYDIQFSFNPTLTPQSTTVNCLSNITQPNALAPTVVDNCGNVITPVMTGYTDTPNPIVCEGTRVYNYTYTDCAGNTANWSFTYVVKIPTFIISTPPTTQNVACVNDIVNPTGLQPAVTDFCGNVITNVSITNIIDTPNPLNCNGTREYVFTYTDCAGNTANWSYIYNIQILPFHISPPSNTTVVHCFSEIPTDPSTIALPNVYDYCGNLITNPVFIGFDDDPNPLVCSGMRKFNFRYTDCNGNTDVFTKIYFLTMNSTNTPIPNGSINVSCLNDISESLISFPETYDACGNLITRFDLISVSANPDPLLCSGGTKTYTYRVYDCAGNGNRTWSFVFNIVSPPFTIPNPPGFTNVNCPNNLFDPIGYIPVVIDACGDVIKNVQEISVVYNPNPIVCQGTRTHTYRYTDCSGNSADWTYTINVNRPQFTISQPSGEITVGCVADIDNMIASNLVPIPVITDFCGEIITNIHITNIVNTPNPIPCSGGKRVYTYTFTDCAGNTANWNFTFNVFPSPLIIPDPDIDIHVSCLAMVVEPTTSLPVVYDACGNLVTNIQLINIYDNPNPLTCVGSRTYTYQYTDCAGSSAIWKCTYLIEMPTFTISEPAGEMTVSCVSNLFEPWSYVPAVTDFCGNAITNINLVSVVNSPNPIVCNGTRTYTFRYTDCAGHTADWSFVFTITRPTFVVNVPNGDTTVYCPSDIFFPTSKIPTVHDPCGNLITIPPTLTNIVDNPSPLLCSGTRTFVYTFTESCFNTTANWSYTFHVQPPQFTMPQTQKDLVVSCASQAVEPTSYLPAVSDYCGRNIYDIKLLSVTDSPNPLICNGTRTYKYLYTDCGGNTATWTCIYHIGNLPQFTIELPPFDTTVSCVSNLFVPTYSMLPEIHDYCGNVISMPYISNVIDSPYPLVCSGSRTFVYTYTDCSGNTANWSYVIHVKAPNFSITAPNGTKTVTCVQDITVPTVFPNVYDYCGNLITNIQLTNIINQPNPLICNGYRSYVFTYTDCSGNTADWMFTYFIEDLPALQLQLHAKDTVVHCLADIFQPDAFLPQASDACGNAITNIQFNGFTDTPSPLTCEGSRVYRYTYYDCSNHSAEWTYTFDVKVLPFTIGIPNKDTTVFCIAELFDPVSKIPVVISSCGDVITDITQSSMIDTPSSLTCEGSRVYSYTYKDCAGNAAVWTYTIHVDMPAFSINVSPGDTTVNCVADIFEPLQYTPVVSDYCGKNITDIRLANVIDSPNPIVCRGSRTFVYTYTDCAGNTADWSFTFNINTPIFYIDDLPGTKTVSCLTDAVPPTSSLPQIYDYCGNLINNITISSIVESPNPLTCEGTRRYNYLYTDCFGNTASWHYTYTIITEPFTITSNDITLTVDCPSQVVPPTNLLPVVLDKCGNIITNIKLTNYQSSPSPITCEGTALYEYTYTDCAGYTGTWKCTYNVVKPPLTINRDTTHYYVKCITEIFEPTNLIPQVHDLCGNLLAAPSLTDIINTPNPLTCSGTRSYVYTYVDCKGQFADLVYKFHVMPELVINAPNKTEIVSCFGNTYEPTDSLPVITNTCGYTLPDPVLLNVVDNIALNGCEGSRVYTYQYEDCAGNKATWTYTFIIHVPQFIITAPPVVNTVKCVADIFEPTALIPKVNDACGNPIENVMLLNIQNNPTNLSCEGSRIYTYRYTDCVGHTADWSYTFIVDIPPFSINIPSGEKTIKCLSEITTPTLPVVYDACGNHITNIALTQVIDDPPNNPLCSGNRTHVYTYTDCAGNTANWSFVFHINHPSFSISAKPLTVNTHCIDSISIAPTAYLPVVLDGCGNAITNPVISNITDNPNPITCNGTRTYTYTYTDCMGNTANWQFTYNLTIIPFSISGSNTDVVVSCISEALVEPHTITPSVMPLVLDNCGNDISGSFLLNVVYDTIGCQGFVSYNYVFYDCANNQATWRFRYHIVPQPINISFPNAQSTVFCPGMAMIEPHTITPSIMPVVYDNCGNNISNNYFISNIISNMNCEGTVKYVYTFVDCSGNSADWTYTYIVDMPGFVINELPINETVSCVSQLYQPDSKLPTVHDYCGNVITNVVLKNVSNNPPTITCEGTRVYLYTFTDCAGNTADWTYTFHVTKPALEIQAAPGYANVNCVAAIIDPSNLKPVVYDVCGNLITNVVLKSVTTDPNPIQCDGTRKYTYTYTDCAGNTADWTYTYNVHPMIPPQIPANGQSVVANIADAIIPAIPYIYDVCGRLVSYTQEVIDTPNPLVCEGTRKYVTTFTDCGGNTSIWTYTYIIVPNNLYMELLGWQHGCNHGSGGSISVRGWGGSGPYIYHWKKTTGEEWFSNPTYSITYKFDDLLAGTYNVFVTDVNGCTQTVYDAVVIESNPAYIGYDFKSICESELPYKYGGTTIYEGGVYSIDFPTTQDCDSTIYLTLTVNPEYIIEYHDTICSFDLPYSWHGQNIVHNGTYYDYLLTNKQCDSTLVNKVTIINALATIGQIHGPTECIFSSEVTSGVLHYSIDLVEGATYYEWTMLNAPWHIEQNGSPACTVYVRTRDVGILQVQAFNSCGGSVISTITIVAHVGIENIDGSSIIIYPNPAKNIINIKFEKFEGLTNISVFDASGKIIDKFDANISSDKEVISHNVSDYKNGIYFFKIKNNTISFTEKIIIQD